MVSVFLIHTMLSIEVVSAAYTRYLVLKLYILVTRTTFDV